MFSCQNHLFEQTQTCSGELFTEKANSVETAINIIREARIVADLLESVEPEKAEERGKAEAKWASDQGLKRWLCKEDRRREKRHVTERVSDMPLAQQLRVYADGVKTDLPVLDFPAKEYNESKGDKEYNRGILGRWRLQSQAVLSGLAVLDADHLDKDPFELFRSWTSEQLRALGVLLVFVTSSSKGMKIVFRALLNLSLIENAKWMAEQLGLPTDKSGADSSRGAFWPGKSDVLFLEPELFTYNNPEYEAQWGSTYREGGSAAAARKQEETATTATTPDSHTSPTVTLTLDDIKFNGVPIQIIVDAWVGQHAPHPGERHRTSLILADHLRYVIGPDAIRIEIVLRGQKWVDDIVRERNENVAQTVRSALGYREDQNMPQRMQKALREAGVPDYEGRGKIHLPYSDWAVRLTKLLKSGGCYEAATRSVEVPSVKPGGVVTACGMYSALLTHCWYQGWDGQMHRLNALALVIGRMAKGKGIAVEQDEAILEILRLQDKAKRSEERQYKKKKKERSTSSKAQKEAALEQPEGIIRYIPVRTSNSILFRRMKNAVEILPDGTEYRLHVVCFSSELLSYVNAGGSFQEKRDILLQSFSNERTGVDYAHEDSINDTLPAFYTFIATGTRTALDRFINARNIGDGLSTRFTSYLLDNEGFKMRPYKSKPKDNSAREDMRVWAERFDSLRGEIKGLEKLTRHIYNMVATRAEEANALDDKTTITMLMRMQDKLMCLCIPQVISTQPSWDEFQRTMTATVTRQHLQFATLFFEILLSCEEALFGQLIQDNYDNEERNATLRPVYDKTATYFQQLPDPFTTADVMNIWGYTSNTTASQRITSLVERRLVEKVSRGQYRKLVSTL